MHGARRRELLAALGIRVYVRRAPVAPGPGAVAAAAWVLVLDPDLLAREADGKLLRHLRRALGDIPLVTEARSGARTVVVGDGTTTADLRLPHPDRLRADPQLKAATWRMLAAALASSSP